MNKFEMQPPRFKLVMYDPHTDEELALWDAGTPEDCLAAYGSYERNQHKNEITRT